MLTDTTNRNNSWNPNHISRAAFFKTLTVRWQYPSKRSPLLWWSFVFVLNNVFQTCSLFSSKRSQWFCSFAYMFVGRISQTCCCSWNHLSPKHLYKGNSASWSALHRWYISATCFDSSSCSQWDLLQGEWVLCESSTL